MKPTISIIIPVYNVEKYLEQCLDSILKQTRNDYEVIMIDDGSTDSSPSICDTYAQQYECMTVIHQKNKGLSSARNTGIRKAQGEWITFLDSDDWWEEKYLECMDFEDVDLCVCGYNVVYPEKSEKVVRNLQSKVIPISDYISQVDNYYGTIFNFAWGKLYRKDIVLRTGLFNENIVLVEDILFNINYYRECQTVRIIENSLVNYRQVSCSLSHRYHEDMFEYYELGYTNYIGLLEQYGVYDEKVRLAILKRYWGNYVESLLGLTRSNRGFREKKKIIREKQQKLLYKECLEEYIKGGLCMENRIQKIGMELMRKKYYLIWFVLVYCYDIQKRRLSC